MRCGNEDTRVKTLVSRRSCQDARVKRRKRRVENRNSYRRRPGGCRLEAGGTEAPAGVLMQYVEEADGAERIGRGCPPEAAGVVPSSGGVPRSGGVGPPMQQTLYASSGLMSDLGLSSRVGLMDQQTLSLLGFPEILQIIQRFAHSPLGKAQVSRMAPLTVLGEIEERLEEVEECRRYIEGTGRPAFHQLQDPHPILASLAIEGQILQPSQALILLDLIRTGREMKSTFSDPHWPRLAETLRSLHSPGTLLGLIERTIDPSGEVRESADPELSEVRRKHAQCRRELEKELERHFRGSKAKFLIQEPFVTLRNGRYVIPVKTEHQRDMPGVVHGTSSSGATLFLEPFSAVELNNQCVNYRELEGKIVRRILRKLTEALSAHRSLLLEIAERIGELDSLFACADFAIAYRCIVPTLNQDKFFRMREARHPLLIETLGPEQVVPISVRVSPNRNILVISGPNTGGKTVALKTIGLFTVMAQCGLPVPAAEAELAVFHQILADIGDGQSIAEQLSTFSAHILAIRRMIDMLDPPTLILLDEMGRGTDPAHGSALGIAVIDFFSQKETYVVATTHQEAIKAFAFSTPEIESASVELDPVSLRPTYQLRLGIAGESSGLEIASQLGMPSPILAQARDLLGRRDIEAERYLARLREELACLGREREELREQLERLKDQQRRLDLEFQTKEKERQAAAERKMKEWRAEFRRSTQQLLESIQDKLEAARVKKETKRREARLEQSLLRKMAPAPAAENVLVGEGEQIYHTFFQKRGIVVHVRNEEATVEIEGKRITAPMNQLQKVEEKESSRKLPPNVTLDVVEEETKPELNLIGCTVDDALIRADKFLDRAFLSHLQVVRIIHGFGTGKLRAALSEFLCTHPHVSEHHVKGGATVVRLEE